MPIDVECKSCMLGFSVGTYHYHSNTTGYFGRTLMVCTMCGTQHELEIPLDDSKTPYRLRSLVEPAIECEKIADHKLLFPKQNWTAQFVLESKPKDPLTCQRCGAADAVTQYLENTFACPNCGDTITGYLSSWMT